MTSINELELHNNQLQDAMGALFALAFFANPSLKRISVGYNYMRQAFSRSLSKLICAQPHKITHLSTMGSVTFSDHLEPLARCTPSLRNLEGLNLAGCGLSPKACATIARLVISSRTLLDLDVSHCKISFQGTRYIIDAMNRNTVVRNFNFSHNDLQSETFEFSIKVASMISRHPALAHLNIAHTNLKREEMVFIGLSLSTSRVLVSLHLSGATLPYYERVFLRSVIAARVGFKFKSMAHKKDVRGIQERNQLLSMAAGEAQEQDLLEYVDLFNELEEQREGLDFEIQDLLKELDTQKTFEGVEKGTKLEDLPEDSKVAALVNKIQERQQEIQAQQQHVEQIYSEKAKSITDQLQLLSGVKNMSQYNVDPNKKEKPDPNKAPNTEIEEVF